MSHAPTPLRSAPADDAPAGGRLRGWLRRRWALVGLVAALLPFGVRVVLLDDAPAYFQDAILQPVTAAHDALGEGGLGPALGELVADPKTGPLPLTVGLLSFVLLGPGLAAIRLGSLLCYLALLLLTHAITRRAGGSRTAATWATLLCGTAPLLYGFSRLEFPDIYVATLFAACLLVILRGHLTTRSALLLGVLTGLGLLTKLSFLPCLLTPGIWFVAGHLTRAGRRRLPQLALAAAVALALAAGWYLTRLEMVAEIAAQSSQNTGAGAHGNDFPLLDVIRGKGDQLLLTLWGRPGMALLWLLAAVALLPGANTLARHGRTTLVHASLLLCLVLLIFDPYSRYLLPAIPPAAALAGIGLARIIGRLPAATRRPAGAGLALCLLGWFVWCNLFPPPLRDRRDAEAGAISPITTYEAMCHELQQNKQKVTLVFECSFTAEWLSMPAYHLGERWPCRYPDPIHPRPGLPRAKLVDYNWLEEHHPGVAPPLELAPRAAAALGLDVALTRTFSRQTGLYLVLERSLSPSRRKRR